MYKIGDMVNHFTRCGGVLAFITGICERSDGWDRQTREYITITYLKPFPSYSGKLITQWVSISPHDELTLVSCPESVPRIQPTL